MNLDRIVANCDQVMKSMPHVLPFERRVLLFRQWIEQEREHAARVRTDITIRRTHVIEDAHVVERAELALIVDVDVLLVARGRVRDVELGAPE